MYSVETHSNSEEYFKNLYIEKDSIHIGTTSTISNLIKENSRNLLKEDYWRIQHIEGFFKAVYPKWTDSLNYVALKVELRNIIRSIKEEITLGSEKIEVQYFEDNLELVLSDILYLVEAGLRTLTNIRSSTEEKVFKAIYNKFIGTDLFKEVSSEIFNEDGLRGFESNLEGFNGTKVNKIYVYNFNYIDMKRFVLFERLKKSGYEVIFRIPYFNGLNNINRCWSNLYKNKGLFQWSEHKGNFTTIAEKSKYLSFVEGINFKGPEDERVVLKTYYEVSDFKRNMKNKRVVSLLKGSLQECLEYEHKEKDHCFQSSLGRFLYYLYDCEVKDEKVTLSFNTFIELMTSGWVEYKGWNGIKLTEFLVRNREYFNGVKTIDDIILRITKLKEIHEVNDIFEESVKARINKNNTKRFLSNPFRALGYVNVEDFNITVNYLEQITLMFKRFLLKAFEGDGELINFKEHLEALKRLFKNQYTLGLSDDSENNWFIPKIWGSLHYNKLNREYIHKEELRELFNILLSIEDKNKTEIEELEELDFSIDQLEGFMLRKRMVEYKGERVLYISDLSYKAYQDYLKMRKKKTLILNRNTTEEILNNNLLGEKKNSAIQGLYLEDISSKASDDYLKFAIGNIFINFSGKKIFSWISGLRGNDSKSVVFKQLESLYETSINVKSGLDFINIINENDLILREKSSNDYSEVLSKHKAIPEVAYRDIDFCEEKFLYSSILDSNPKYFTDFHHKLLLSIVVSALKDSIDESYENIRQHVLPLFPQWPEVVKDNILLTNYAAKNIREYKLFEGVNYPKGMDKLYLLRSKYVVTERYKIKNRYKEGNMKTEEVFKDFLKIYFSDKTFNKGYHCIMCPHAFICRKGDFGVEFK